MKDYYPEDELFEDWIYGLKIPGACKECGEEVSYLGNDDWGCTKCYAVEKTENLAISRLELQEIIDQWHQEYLSSDNPEAEADKRLDDSLNEMQEDIDEGKRLAEEARQMIEEYKQNSNYGTIQQGQQELQKQGTFKKFLKGGIPVFIILAALIVYLLKPQYIHDGVNWVTSALDNLREGSENTAISLGLQDDTYNVAKSFYQDYFKKDYSEITADEFAKIKYIKVYNLNCKVFIEASDYIKSDFQTDDEFKKHLFYWEENLDNEANKEDVERVCDLSDLKNIEEIAYRSLRNEPLIFFDGAPIHCITTNETLDQICEKYDASQITELNIQGGEKDVLAGISKFSSLITLRVSGTSYFGEAQCYDISELSNCPDLECLCINSPISNKGIETVSKLTKLKTLNVMELDLAKCSFLENFPDLEGLEIDSVSDPNAFTYLASVPHLKRLKIHCGIDLGQISDLKELEDLNVDVEDTTSIKELSNFPNLQTLTLDINEWNKEFGDYSAVDLSAIGNLPNLKICTLYFGGFYSDGVNGLENLFNKSGLNKLAILNVSGPEDDIFIDQSILTQNMDLSMLDLRGIRFRDQQNQSIPISEIIKEYPSLTRLNLVDEELTDVEFLTDFNNLEVLGIESNEIRDVSPLFHLTSLKKIYIHGNEILVDDCPPNVEVVSDSSYGSLYDREQFFE